MKPTLPDGLILSRWRRHRSTPFGAEFAYTDARDLTLPNTPRPRWYTRLWPHKRPLAYLVIDKDSSLPQVIPRDLAYHINPIELADFTPIYDRQLLENLLFALDEGLFFTDNPDTPHSP
jgi:hypothetical protein